MEKDFWHQRWQENKIGFHQSEFNPFLVTYFGRLSVDIGKRVLLPLCGKTHDIVWLLEQGFSVVGVELSAIAIQDLFADLKLEPEISKVGPYIQYKAKEIDIFVGDIFDLNTEIIGPIHAIYDRAALIALPEDMRLRYSKLLCDLTDVAPQLLISIEYDQTLMDGPPFSVNETEIHQLYQSYYDLEPVASEDISGGIKGICPARETVYICKKKARS